MQLPTACLGISRRFVKLDALAPMALRDRTKCHLGAVLHVAAPNGTARRMASDPTPRGQAFS